MMSIRQLVVDAITLVQNAHDRRLCTLIQEIADDDWNDPQLIRKVADKLHQLRRDMAADTEMFLTSARDQN